jgi:hypothetical protein
MPLEFPARVTTGSWRSCFRGYSEASLMILVAGSETLWRASLMAPMNEGERRFCSDELDGS